jgi:hypothetical protein
MLRLGVNGLNYGSAASVLGICGSKLIREFVEVANKVPHVCQNFVVGSGFYVVIN